MFSRSIHIFSRTARRQGPIVRVCKLAAAQPALQLQSQRAVSYGFGAMTEPEITASDMDGLNTYENKQDRPQSSSLHQVNAWAGPGPAAFDFRSDTITTPTANMLKAIQECTLMDDVFMEDASTNGLEKHIAELTGHEAALFVLSGTQGNQIALRTHLEKPPYAVLTDYRAHILNWEAGGPATLCGAHVQGIVPSNGKYLTLADIKKHIVLSDDVHACPTKVISLENTLGGVTTPVSEIAKICEFARANNVKLHLDGARIWEAVASGAGSLTDFLKLVDSASLCFSKGLGAPVGSILVGNKEFIRHARWVRKLLGGGLRQVGVLTSAARVAVDETFGTGPNGEGGKLKDVHMRARQIADKWVELGGKLTAETETNMVWFDLNAIGGEGMSPEAFKALGKEEGLKLGGGRLVLHYQIGDNAVERLERVMRKALKKD